MSLPALTWRRIADQVVITASVDAYLTAILAAFNAAVYSDGTARTAGTARAWSATSGGSPIEYIVLTPPSGATSAKVLVAGSSGAKTPKMAGSDSYLASGLHVGLGPDGGALTTWDGVGGSDPLGAGMRFSGFTRISGACTGGSGVVCVYESLDAVTIMIKVATSWYGVILGGLFDAHSSDLADVEADGRVYGILNSGSGAIPNNFDSSTGFTASYTASSGGFHAWAFTPGSATLRTLRRVFDSQSGCTYTLTSGRAAFIPACWYQDGTTSDLIGELRGARRGKDSRQRRVSQVSGTDYAYALGGSDAADQDVLYLLAQ